ncbi:MAG: methyltransferase domain-containing protein [Gemmatimonadota bacterium]|jgi:ubiquinone/menaquinone biosynthesis C-methylase UbiE
MRHLLGALIGKPHTCPWWFCYTFDNPLRRLVHDPAAILAGLVSPGDTAVDAGCGMGFFSLGLARLVGPGGRVIAIDLQAETLRRASRRARRRGLAGVIEFRRCTPERLGLTETVDFALAFWMAHEVASLDSFFVEMRGALRAGGRLLIAEPLGHVTAARFEGTLAVARAGGFDVTPGPRVRFSRSAVCTRR